jgi:hypothetical protein
MLLCTKKHQKLRRGMTQRGEKEEEEGKKNTDTRTGLIVLVHQKLHEGVLFRRSLCVCRF